jgi:hypothetical protein
VTEVDWLRATDPGPMLSFLNGRVSDRKLRLFGCSCCRHIWHLMPDDLCRRAIVAAEEFADGLATVEEWRHASEAAEAAIVTATTDANMDAADAATDAAKDVYNAAVAAAWAIVSGSREATAFTVQRAIQSDFLRDIVGNPFRPVSVNPDWLSSKSCPPNVVVSLIFQAFPCTPRTGPGSGCGSRTSRT